MLIRWTYLIFLIWQCQGHSESSPRNPLKYYEYIQPKATFLPSHSQLSNLQRLEDFKLVDQFQPHTRSRLTFNAFNTTFHILLNPTENLFHPTASIHHDTKDSKHSPIALKAQDFLIYNGPVLNDYRPHEHHEIDWLGLDFDQTRERGWASIMVHPSDFQGAFSHNGETYTIQPIDDFSLLRNHYDPKIPSSISRPTKNQPATTIIYRSTDYYEESKGHPSSGTKDTCGVSRHHSNYHVQKKNLVGNLNPSRLWRRNDVTTCSSKKKTLYMGVAADCNYVNLFNSLDKTRKKIISDWNTVSTLYEKEFNVKLGIIKIEIPSEKCPTSIDNNYPWNRECSPSYEMSSRLDDFSVWRAKKGRDHAGLWHLVTSCKTGSQVGLAWESTICISSVPSGQSKNQGGTERLASGTGTSAVTNESWKVIAHEIGHNFGAVHDCIKETCPPSPGERCCPCGDGGSCDCQGKYIMNPESKANAGSVFSPCSKETICRTINTIGTCITSSDQIPTYDFAMCGNGIREQGEECDCGGDEGCKDNPCCDAKTCKYKQNAQCDDATDSCCKGCRPKPVDTICRAQTGECDVEEKCDGKSGICPDDNFLPNGTPCSSSSSSLKCANGLCTSRNLQCQSRTAGTEYATKEACNGFLNDPCKLSCATTSVRTCVGLSGTFVDGTECGRNAYCNQGNCEGGNAWDKLLTWGEQNRFFAIAIVVIVGFLLLSFISSCIFTGTRRYRARQNTHRLPDRNSIPPNPHQYPLATRPSAPPAYVDPTRYNGGNHPHDPDGIFRAN